MLSRAVLGTVAFWILVWLPGLWVTLRFSRPGEERGPLSAVALGYLASFALLTPISIAGYSFGLPLEALTGSIAIAALASAPALARRAWTALSDRAPRWPSPIGSLAVLLLFGDLYLSLCNGAYLGTGGDPGYHIGRVRALLIHGFTDVDPFTGFVGRERAYTANIYHALMAACAQLTHLDPIEVWTYTLAFAKLVAAAGAAELAWIASRRRWAAWLSACFVLVWTGPLSVLLYPNAIAPYWLFPLGLSAVVTAVTTRPSLAAIATLAAVAVVTPQVHALNYLFFVLIAGPTLLFFAVRAGANLAGNPEARRRWACVLVLLLGAPWPAAITRGAQQKRVVKELVGLPIGSAQGDRAEEEPRPTALPKRSLRLGDDWFIKDPAGYLRPQSRQFQLLAALVLGLMFGPRRRFGALAGIFVTMALWFHFPPLYVLLNRLFGSPWLVERMTAMPYYMYLALFPAMLAVLLPERWALPWVQVLALGAVFWFAYQNGIDTKKYSRRSYLSCKMRHGPGYNKMRQLAGRARFLSETIASGATVWADLRSDRKTVMYCDCYLLATDPRHGTTRGLGSEMKVRRQVHAMLVDRNIPLEARITYLKAYKVRFFLSGNKHFERKIRDLYEPIFVSSNSARRLTVVEVDPDRHALPSRPVGSVPRLETAAPAGSEDTHSDSRPGQEGGERPFQHGRRDPLRRLGQRPATSEDER